MPRNVTQETGEDTGWRELKVKGFLGTSLLEFSVVFRMGARKYVEWCCRYIRGTLKWREKHVIGD